MSGSKKAVEGLDLKSTRWLRRRSVAHCRSSRRATRLMATWPPMRRWSWPSRWAKTRGRWPSAWPRRWPATPTWRRRRWPVRASSTCGSPTASGGASSRSVLEQGANYRPLDLRRVGARSMSSTCRPIRPAAACRPRAGHRLRRRAGDAARAWAGWAVTREYYINDGGAQIEALARSIHHRYREALGGPIRGPMPAGLYPLAASWCRSPRRSPSARAARAGSKSRKRCGYDLRASEGVAAVMGIRIREDLRLPSACITTCSRPSGELVENGRHRRGGAGPSSQTRMGLIYTGTLPPPKGKPRGRLGGARAAASVQGHGVRRRGGPAAQAVRRQLDLFRGRPRLPSKRQVSPRLPLHGEERVGCRPWRLRQAHAGRRPWH